MWMWAGWGMDLEGEDSKHLLGLKCHCDLWQRGFWPVEQEGGLSVKSSRGQVCGAGRVDRQNGTVASERASGRATGAVGIGAIVETAITRGWRMHARGRQGKQASEVP